MLFQQTHGEDLDVVDPSQCGPEALNLLWLHAREESELVRRYWQQPLRTLARRRPACSLEVHEPSSDQGET